MKRLAATVAVIAFFALALIGWACGASPYGCGMKAATGALGVYLLARISGRILIGIVADGIARNLPQPEEDTEGRNE